MQFETHCGYRVRVDRLNPGAGRLVVLLHGFGASSFSWRTVAPALAAGAEVLLYDRPGFGFTDRPTVWAGTDPYSLAGQVELLASLLAGAATRQVVMVGHSAGALVAAEYTLRHPDGVAGLVLESPAILRGSPVPEWLKPLLRTAPLAALGTALLGRFPTAGRRILESAWFDPAKLTADVLAGYEAPLATSGWQRGLWLFSTAEQRSRVASDLHQLQVPALVITGAHDRIVKVADSEQVAAQLPHSRLAVVPEAGHLAHEEQPAQFLAAVDDFLRGLRP